MTSIVRYICRYLKLLSMSNDNINPCSKRCNFMDMVGIGMSFRRNKIRLSSSMECPGYICLRIKYNYLHKVSKKCHYSTIYNSLSKASRLMSCQDSNLQGIPVDKIERIRNTQFHKNYKIHNSNKSCMGINISRIGLCSSKSSQQSMRLDMYCFGAHR